MTIATTEKLIDKTSRRTDSTAERKRGPVKVLQLAAVDIAIKNLLLPLIRSLSAEGFEVHAAARKLDAKTVSTVESAGAAFHDIEIERNLNPTNIIKASMSIDSLLSEGYDIIHLHTPIAAFIGRIIGKLRGIPRIIYTAHGFYFHENMGPVEKLFFKSIEFIACRYSTDYLFCQSAEDTMTALKGGFIAPDRILHIGNGVDLERFKPDLDTSRRVRKKLNLPIDSVVITFMGRMVREKGILELLEAFRRVSALHPDTYLILAGDSRKTMDRDTETEKKLRTFARDGEIGKRIVFTGFVERPEEILCASDIFVLPSHREGLPRTICEAMACGLPVVATDIRGPREQIASGETGFLVPVHSPDELAGKIGLLVGSRGLRLTMGEKARNTAESNFDEKKVIELQLSIYRKLREELTEETNNKTS